MFAAPYKEAPFFNFIEGKILIDNRVKKEFAWTISSILTSAAAVWARPVVFVIVVVVVCDESVDRRVVPVAMAIGPAEKQKVAKSNVSIKVHSH